MQVINSVPTLILVAVMLMRFRDSVCCSGSLPVGKVKRAARTTAHRVIYAVGIFSGVVMGLSTLFGHPVPYHADAFFKCVLAVVILESNYES